MKQKQQTNSTPSPDTPVQENNFTGGEWNIETNVSHYPFIMGDDNNLIAMLIDGKDGSLFYGRTLEETNANAALIAEAPANFKAIVAIKALLNGEYDNKYLLETGSLFADNDKNIIEIIKHFCK